MNNLFFITGSCMLVIALIISFNLKNLDKIKRSTSKAFIFMDVVLGIMMILIAFAN